MDPSDSEPRDQSVLDLVIIGGGPIGIDAAIRAVRQNRDVTLLEKEKVGNHLRQWNGVQLFTPFEMNRSPSTLDFGEKYGIAIPGDDEYLTGPQFVRRWLEPLVQQSPLSSVVKTGQRVESIAREGLLKGDRLGCDRRDEPPFRLIVKNDSRTVVRARKIIDASGTFGQANPLGSGGMVAPGEPGVSDRIYRRFPPDEQLEEWTGERILVVGAGYSAATNLKRLTSLQEPKCPDQIDWLVRSESGPPIGRVDDDPLPARDELAKTVNERAISGDVNLIRGTVVNQLTDTDRGIRVECQDGRSTQVDRIVSNTGYRPDRGLYRELQFHECYGTEGPIDLAGSLLAQDGADCLDVEPGGGDLLVNPEPNFFVVGSKSYGRQSNFLLENGFRQVSDLFETVL